jgi:putative toxin-antitoxin system antitoxin component (TIGR02293 family)
MPLHLGSNEPYFDAKEFAMSIAAATSQKEVKRSRATGVVSTLQLYRAGRAEHIKLIRDGMPATQAKAFLSELSLSPRTTMLALRLSPATINRKAAARQALAPEDSERVFGVARLVGQVEAMVEESGNVQGFDARQWVSRWLVEPVPALGGQRPLDLLDTMEGQTLVSETLARMQSGAYA